MSRPGEMKLSQAEQSRIVTELDGTYEESKDNQSEAKRKWDIVDNYIDGRQMMVSGGRAGLSHEEAEATDATGDIDKEMMIVNEIRRVFMVDMQRLTSYAVDPDVIPESTSQQDKTGARLGKIYLKDMIRRTGENKIKQKLASNLIRYNTAFIKVNFNPWIGPRVRKPKFSMFGIELGSKLEPAGDIELLFPNPRCLTFPINTMELEKADWVQETHVKSVDEVFRTTGKVVAPENIANDNLRRFNNIQYTKSDSAKSHEKDQRKVLLKERMYRPCEKYRNGAIFTWANKILIRSSELTPFYSDLPYFQAKLMFDDMDIFGDSPLWDLINEQDLLNEGMSAVRRWVKLLRLWRMWFPEGCGVDEEEYDNATGVGQKYNGDKAPFFETPPELPVSVQTTINNARDFIASHGFSNELQKMKKAVSGNALGILQEMDDTIFRPGLDSVEDAMSRAGKMILETAAKFIDTNRLIKMSSRQGWEIKTFRGEMLNDNFHAEIKLQTALPMNKYMRSEMLLKYLKEGVLTIDDVKANIDLGGVDKALEDAQKQYEIADGVVQALLDYPASYKLVVDEMGNQYEIPRSQPHEFDNHPLMAARLKETMQESFDNWEEPVQMAFAERLKFHDEMNQEAVQKEMDMQAMAAGKPPMGAMPAAGAELPPMGDGNPILPDSFQAPEQQPDRSAMPMPIQTGPNI